MSTVTMRAIVVRAFGTPDVLKLETVPVPAAGPGQVLVRVRAVGVNPVDTYIRSGIYARKPALPYTPGADLGGVVEAVGSGVTRVRPGDRIYAHAVNGACAEFAVCEEWQVNPIPNQISFGQGAAMGVPFGTAWRGLFIRGRAKAGDTVLIHGASGGVGTAAVQIARAQGLRVIGTAGTEQGLALVRAQGAHETFDHRDPKHFDQVLDATGGAGVNVVLEMLANENLDRDLDLLAFNGRVIVIGSRGRIEIDPRKTMGKDAAILGMTLFNTTPPEFHEIHAGLVAGLENGTLKPVVTRELPFEDAATAHQAVMEPGAMGKIVLIP